MTEYECGYSAWWADYHRLTDEDRRAISAHINRLPYRPSFLLVPLIRAGDRYEFWQPVIQAVRRQLYGDWNLALPEGWIDAVPDTEGRHVKVANPQPEEEGQRRAFLNAIAKMDLPAMNFIVPLPPGALLDERALYEFAVASVAEPQIDVLYADQDRINALTGEVHSPRFKTAFDPELMLGRDALGVPIVYRWQLLAKFEELLADTKFICVGLHDLALRAWSVIPEDRFRHVPEILCHCMDTAGSLPDWDATTAQQIITHHIHAAGDPTAEIGAAPLAPAWCRVKRTLPPNPPLVSIIIPTRNAAALIRNCVSGLLERTHYRKIEILVVDNGSTDSTTLRVLAHLERDHRIRVLRKPGPFNYPALNNAAAREASGEVLLLLNDDTEVIDPDWLREMVSHAIRSDVGAVGAKLYYEDGRIQHAGIVLGCSEMISHQLRLSPSLDPGPQGELALTRTVLAVTGACLAVRRSVFWEVGGLDEQLAVAFNDVDFCLRLGDHGYRIVWTPFAELRHLESASRGDDTTPERRARLLNELALVRNRWSSDMESDPYHNPNIVFGWEGAGLAAPPRKKKAWL